MPALQAHLDRAAIPRLPAAPDDLVERHQVRRPAQVLGELALRERAEAAAEVADVRVVDVPRDDVADGVAAHLTAKRVGRARDRRLSLASRLEERGDIVLVELDSLPDLAERLADRGCARKPCRHARRAAVRATGVERVAVPASRGEVEPGGNLGRHTRRPAIVAGEAGRVRGVAHRGRDGRDAPMLAARPRTPGRWPGGARARGRGFGLRSRAGRSPAREPRG